MAKKILSGAKKIRFTLWNEADTALESDVMVLDNVIADTVALTQDDPETNEIECETRDEPIYSATQLGDYTITMDSADVNGDILVKCMGFKEVDGAYFAPTSYVARYAQLEVEFDKDILVMPRVLMNSKFDASTLKTGSAKGTIAGTGYSCKVTPQGAETAIETPFFSIAKGKSWTVAPLDEED